MWCVFDAGGTNLRVAVSRNGTTLQRTRIVPIPKRFSDGLALLWRTARELSGSRNRITKVAGGFAGPLDRQKTRMLQSTHLPDYARKPLLRDISRLFHAPVQLENDSALVALGEAVAGAGKGQYIVAYVGIGTGIGGARIVGGRIDENAHGFEPGHHIIEFRIERHRHPSPHPGDWESFVSGSAMAITHGRAAHELHVRQAWRHAARLVGVGLINVSMFWSPDIIVLGGSLMKRLRMSDITRAFRARLKIFPAAPRVRRAQLGDEAGLVGALALLRQTDPAHARIR